MADDAAREPGKAASRTGVRERHDSMMHKRKLAGAAAGAAAVLLLAGLSLASAQAPDAEERCEPDVMRYCSEFKPDRDRIVKCLKAKQRQLSRSCLTALQKKPETTGQHRRQR